MKLKCPACGAPIPASAINIQQMVAICPACDNVFRFGDTFAPRRRKLKAPAQFRVADDDPERLDMAFKWSWRTEPPVGLLAVGFAFMVSLITLLGMIAEGAPPLAMIMPLMPLTLMSYILLTLAVNRTHYESDGETLKVYTAPLPYFRYGKKTVAVDEIERVSVERPAYAPFPEGKAGFYNVYVHTFDGDKLQIAAVVNYEHAHFIAQEIEAHLQALRANLLPAADEVASHEESFDELPPEAARKALRS